MPPPHLVPQPQQVWDESVLGTLLFEGYYQEQESSLQRSDRVYSEPHYRRFAGLRPIRMVVGVEQTPEQWSAFRTFWEDTLSWGMQWFQIDIVTTSGLDTFTVHLSDWTAAPILGNLRSLSRLEMRLEALSLDTVNP